MKVCLPYSLLGVLKCFYESNLLSDYLSLAANLSPTRDFFLSRDLGLDRVFLSTVFLSLLSQALLVGRNELFSGVFCQLLYVVIRIVLVSAHAIQRALACCLATHESTDDIFCRPPLAFSFAVSVFFACCSTRSVSFGAVSDGPSSIGNNCDPSS